MLATAHYWATVALDHGHRLCFGNKTVAGAVDDIVKTDKLPPARAGADGQSPSIASWSNTKQRAFAKHQSFDIGGTKSMSPA
jgi:hypothetical protein